MLDVLSGFATIWVIMGVGFLLARVKVVGPEAQRILSLVSFNSAAPCLLFLVVSRANLSQIFSMNILVSASAVILVATGYLLISTFVMKRSVGHKVIGAFCSAYVNANNIGLPVTAFVLGDTGWIAPIVLMQVVILQPLGLAVLDTQNAKLRGEKPSLARQFSTPIRNPLTIGVLLGLLFNWQGWTLPNLILNPVEMLSQFAVPGILIGFGVSLAFAELPKRGSYLNEVIGLSFTKLIIHPLVAVGLALAFRLEPATIEAVAVLAGLPVAQNVFVFAVSYDQSIPLARDTLFITTVLSTVTLALFIGLLRFLFPG